MIKELLKPVFHKSRRFFAKQVVKRHTHLTIVGITGSFGKTSTTRAITQILSERFKTLQTDLNLDTIYNVPETILKLKDEEKLVLELGVDHKEEMWQHLEIARPTVAVITGIAPVHADQDHLGSLEGIMTEKGHLLEVLPPNGWAVLNHDDPKVRIMAAKTKAQVIWYGTDPRTCNLWADNIKVDFTGTTFTLHVERLYFSGKSTVDINTSLIGRHHIYTILAAAAVAFTQGMTLEEIARGALKLEPLEGRLSIEKGPLGMTLINDARRANVSSTIAGLETLRDLPGKRKIAILGQMGEMGTYEEEGHREVGRKAAQLAPDLLVCVGEATRFIAEEAGKKSARDKVIFCKDVFEAAEKLKPVIKEGDLVYLKGSLLRHMERIILLLEGKKVDTDEEAAHRYQIYR